MGKDTLARAADADALVMMKFTAEIGPSEAYAPWFLSREGAIPSWAAGDDFWG